MSENTKIEWCDATVNHWAGCTAVSPACDNCYAKAMAKRLWGVGWGAGVPRHPFANATATLKALNRKAKRLGKPLRVFHNSLSDFFDNEVSEQWRAAAMRAIMDTPNLIHLVLTKRIGNAKEMLDRATWLICRDRIDPTEWKLTPNLWLGATICNQVEADRDIPKLLAVPAAKRFLSMEPLLGPVDLSNWIGMQPAIGATTYRDDDDIYRCDLTGTPVDGVDWVIVGGESGPNARPMHPDWARSLRDQCQAADVPFLFKQWGEWSPHRAIAGGDEGGDLRRGYVRYLQGDGREPDGHFRKGDAAVAKVGKKSAGRLLDGCEWNGVPS